jgi:hypothetical protein
VVVEHAGQHADELDVDADLAALLLSGGIGRVI